MATAALALVAVLVVALLFRDDLRGLASNGATAGAHAKQQRLRVDSLDELRRTVFFDPVTREPAIWYAIGAGGDLHLYAQPGRDPENGEWLKPVTNALVQQLERRLKTHDQERIAEAERRAATTRADAEISRARQAPDKRSLSASQRPPTQAATSTTTVDGPATVATSAATQPPSGANLPAGNAAAPPASVARVPSPADVREHHARTGDDDARPRDYGTRHREDLRPRDYSTRQREDAGHRDYDGGQRDFDVRARSYDAARRDVETRSHTADAERAAAYDALVSDARALIEAGRYGEARAKAQRALHVDPRRMEARTVWAEAQTRLDEMQFQPFASRSRPRQSF